MGRARMNVQVDGVPLGMHCHCLDGSTLAKGVHVAASALQNMQTKRNKRSQLQAHSMLPLPGDLAAPPSPASLPLPWLL